jgi:hypothetical protein
VAERQKARRWAGLCGFVRATDHAPGPAQCAPKTMVLTP